MPGWLCEDCDQQPSGQVVMLRVPDTNPESADETSPDTEIRPDDRTPRTKKILAGYIQSAFDAPGLAALSRIEQDARSDVKQVNAEKRESGA